MLIVRFKVRCAPGKSEAVMAALQEIVHASRSLDGVLGSGDLIMVDALSAGTHDLTLTGRDADGNTATYSVQLTVQPAPTQPAGPTSGTIEGTPRPLILIAVAAALALVGLVVIVAAIVVFRRRKP